jgi:hypothetical protein
MEHDRGDHVRARWADVAASAAACPSPIQQAANGYWSHDWWQGEARAIVADRPTGLDPS